MDKYETRNALHLRFFVILTMQRRAEGSKRGELCSAANSVCAGDYHVEQGQGLATRRLKGPAQSSMVLFRTRGLAFISLAVSLAEGAAAYQPQSWLQLAAPAVSSWAT